MTTELSDQQRSLYEALFEDRDEDVPIADMYRIVKGRDDLPLPSNKSMQEYLGPFITRINRKLNGQRIEPGEKRRTYRLNTNPKD